MIENRENFVILVDEQDRQIGEMEKMEAHKDPHLHRAISVFIVNDNGDWLLQQRAFNKYHSKGLWSNACCTHPFPGESTKDAARRRLKQELGMDTDLSEIFLFQYQVKLDNDLTECELDHVFVGRSSGSPVINPDEVHDYKYVCYDELALDIEKNPRSYTEWFKMIYKDVQKYFRNKGN